MFETKIKIINNKLSVGNTQIALPNSMFFDGNNCSDGTISFASTHHLNPITNIEVCIKGTNIDNWEEDADALFCEMEHMSSEFSIATNGIPGIAYYACDYHGREFYREAAEHNRMLLEADDPYVSTLTVDDDTRLEYCAIYGYDPFADECCDEEPQDEGDLLCVCIAWTTTDSVSGDNYVGRINELLKDKVIAEMLNSIERV